MKRHSLINIVFISIVLLVSAECTQKEKKDTVVITEEKDIDDLQPVVVVEKKKEEKLNKWENQDWLLEHKWRIMTDTIDWHRYPIGEFRKLDIPPEAVLYKERLRNERFAHMYQTDDKTKLIPFYAAFYEGIGFNISFEDNYSRLIMSRKGTPWTSSKRVGEQYDPEHPLVGVWGRLPVFYEIRLVEPDDYVFYLDINDTKISGFAIRHGTYLFKQVGDKVFESESSFPDGHMRLEIINEERLLLTPLFELPEEEGLVEPLKMEIYIEDLYSPDRMLDMIEE